MTDFDPKEGLDQEAVSVAAAAIEEAHDETITYRTWAHSVLTALTTAGFAITKDMEENE